MHASLQARGSRSWNQLTFHLPRNLSFKLFSTSLIIIGWIHHLDSSFSKLLILVWTNRGKDLDRSQLSAQLSSSSPWLFVSTKSTDSWRLSMRSKFNISNRHNCAFKALYWIYSIWTLELTFIRLFISFASGTILHAISNIHFSISCICLVEQHYQQDVAFEECH